MNIKFKYGYFKIKNGCISLFVNISKEIEIKENKNIEKSNNKIFLFGKENKNKTRSKQIFWLNYSNKKEQERILGKNTCNSDYHFCIIIPNIITLDTAYKGKKIFNSRINLTRLFKKDYHIYSNSGDDVQSC